MSFKNKLFTYTGVGLLALHFLLPKVGKYISPSISKLESLAAFSTSGIKDGNVFRKEKGSMKLSLIVGGCKIGRGVIFGPTIDKLVIEEDLTRYTDCGINGFDENHFYTDIFEDRYFVYVSTNRRYNGIIAFFTANYKAKKLVDHAIETFNIK
ncbi:hypothetical protein J4476_01190 [Candidatus Woesearchaeota archaeon]|nr:MAG: hypothetical protein QT09_C0014G0072 [archaeon GW2011_AR18]MBS3161293.1 hypothetical protein [Candidatus Woesearchaeota archaeon]HIH25757.1 hypothetical protein [Nanoarchaeota archaeon]